ncbi:MAG TPA: DUF3224 domain-containing protein [Micromonosporaceae bacterium]|nr:DUF3224 domain-containing protein [Micromonosporaceae bacterium]
METQAKATLRMANWAEEAHQEGGEDGIRLCTARSDITFSGDLEGQGGCRWLLAYPPDGPVSFVGHQSFAGKLSGRSGTFVLEMNGSFKDATAYVTWTVVPGSGTGELTGLTGSGGYEAPLGQPDVDVTLTHRTS